MSGENKSYHRLLIGTYTQSGKSKGIYVYDFDRESGDSHLHTTAKVDNPSYIVLNGDQDCLYSVSDQSAPSYVNGLRYSTPGGDAELISSSVTQEEGLCNIVVSPDGGHILTANYNSGSVSVFRIQKEGTTGPETQLIKYQGSGPVSERQEASHIHCVRYCPCGKYVFITDLGNDAIYRYNVSPDSEKYIDETTLRVFKMTPGSGPRHFVFDPTGDFMYLANELTASVSVFSYEKGEIVQIQNLMASRTGSGDGGDIKISPDGKYVYMSVRDNVDDGIALYSRNAGTGLLQSIGYQSCVEHPRNIEFSPDGRFFLVAGMKADTVQVFECLPDGLLRYTEKNIDVPTPTCLVFTR